MKKIRVLIVEDDIKISELHKRFTEKVEGFSVEGIANTIQDALDMADILEPDLVLLDLFFPEGNGMQFLWDVRKTGKSIDIILITAAKEAHSVQEALRGGAFDYIVKPVIFDRFKTALEKYREYRIELEQNPIFEQANIDHLIRSHSSENYEESGLPKGIDPITLKKIYTVFEDRGEGVSADEVGKKIGASRNTARRYLEYLVSVGYLFADIDYGAVGRPERKFHRQ